jgi:hypothetical protein
MERPFSAYQGDEPYVFVCYSHANAEIVYPELVWLRDQGCNVWYDEGISPGGSWTDELADAIDRSNLLLFFGSPESVVSKHCVSEIGYAIDNDIPVLAVYLKETDLPSGMRLRLNSQQAVNKYAMNIDQYKNSLLKGTTKYLSLTESQSTDRLVLSGKLIPGLRASAGNKSVAVLPLASRSTDPEDEVLSDGISEERYCQVN